MSRDSVWNCNQIMKSVQLYTPIASCTLEIYCGVLHQDLRVLNLQTCCNPWPQHSSDLGLQSYTSPFFDAGWKLWLNYTEVMLHIHVSLYHFPKSYIANMALLTLPFLNTFLKDIRLNCAGTEVHIKVATELIMHNMDNYSVSFCLRF